MYVVNIHLSSAWNAGHNLVEQDKDLAEFHLACKFKDLEAQMGADLLNPFGSAAYEDHDDETEELTPSQENPVPTEMFNLSDLVDKECACNNGLSCTIELPDGKRVHKARILHKFLKYSKQSNSTDCLRRVANISKFAQPALIANTYGEDGSVTEMECILIQDPVAMIVRCEGVPFLAITQVNSIKVDGNTVTYVNKDVLPESTVLIGIQILNLKAVSMVLADGREGDWMWDKGSDTSLTVLGKYIQQISPEIVRKEEENLPGTFVYGFQSDELHDLAAMMFRSLTVDDICKLVNT